MGTLRAVLEHPEDLMALVRIKVEAARMKRQIPPQPHWAFCYSMLDKISRTFAFVIQLLPPDLRNAVCIFYLVLRALDTIEDDPNISSDKKVPVLQSYYQHIRDSDWSLSCGREDFKILVDKFHFVSMAFLELEKSYQGIIEDIAKKMGAGMSNFMCKEVETVEDYDEYCHIAAGLVGLGLSRLFDAAGLEVLVPESLSNSMGLFLQKASVIRDYSEDINEVPNPRIFWPRQIWSKYTDKLEDLKYEENSKKAVECLNDMVTNALMHVEDCLQYMSTLQDPAIFQFCAIPQIMAIGLLAFYYNNVEVFRRVVNMRHGLAAQIVARTRNMSDVYDAFFEFSGMLKSKVDKNDPNAVGTLNRVEAIQKACIKSGLLSKRGYYLGVGKQRFNPMLITIVFLLLSVFVVILSKK